MWLQGVGIAQVAHALTDALRAGDKDGRKALAGLLTRFFLFEELPPDVMLLLAPLFQARKSSFKTWWTRHSMLLPAYSTSTLTLLLHRPRLQTTQSQAKDPKVLRSLFYLAEVFLGRGSAGTPTLFDPALAKSRRAEANAAAQALLAEAWRLLQQPGLDSGLRRATFFLVAAAARGSEQVRRQLGEEIQRAISAADALASAAATAPTGGRGAGRSAGAPAGPRSAATDWELQHTVFAANRLSGAAAGGGDEVSRSFVVGVGSPDPVGARHALALGVEVAYRVRHWHDVAAAGVLP